MFKLEKEVAKGKLVLADYVNVHHSGDVENQTQNRLSRGVLVRYEDFFQRIHKQRGEFKPKCRSENNVIYKGNKHQVVQQRDLIRSKAG